MVLFLIFCWFVYFSLVHNQNATSDIHNLSTLTKINQVLTFPSVSIPDNVSTFILLSFRILYGTALVHICASSCLHFTLLPCLYLILFCIHSYVGTSLVHICASCLHFTFLSRDLQHAARAQVAVATWGRDPFYY